MFTAGDVLSRVRFVTQDSNPDFQRNSDTELLNWLDDAIVNAIAVLPMVRSMSQVMTLVAGSVQTLPDRVIQLLDVNCNIAPDGVTRGRTIRVANRQLIDDQEPSWRSRKPSSTILHYLYDERVQGEFEVYPPAIAGTKIEARLAIAPAKATTLASTIDIAAQYMPALVAYVIGMAEAKDSEASNGEFFAAFMGQFKEMLQAQAGTAVSVTPNTASKS